LTFQKLRTGPVDDDIDFVAVQLSTVNHCIGDISPRSPNESPPAGDLSCLVVRNPTIHSRIDGISEQGHARKRMLTGLAARRGAAYLTLLLQYSADLGNGTAMAAFGESCGVADMRLIRP
jgi:hypothetical protein